MFAARAGPAGTIGKTVSSRRFQALGQQAQLFRAHPPDKFLAPRHKQNFVPTVKRRGLKADGGDQVYQLFNAGVVAVGYFQLVADHHQHFRRRTDADC